MESVYLSDLHGRTLHGLGYFVRFPGGRVLARINGANGATNPIRRLCPSRIWLGPGNYDGFRQGQSMDLTLCLGSIEIGPLHGLLGTIEYNSAGRPSFAAVALRDVSLERAREIMVVIRKLYRDDLIVLHANPPMRREIIDGAPRIRRAIRAIFSETGVGRIYTEKGFSGELRVTGIEPESDMPLRCAMDGFFVRPPFTVEMSGCHFHYRFMVIRIRRIQGGVAFPVPSRVEVFRRRRWRRTEAPSGYQVSFRHPQFSGMTVRAPLVDVSREGMGFEADPIANVLYPGMELGEIQVQGPGHDGVTIKGKVSWVPLDNRDGSGRAVCGVRIEGYAPEDPWVGFFEQFLYPTTANGAFWTDDVWDVYTESGYFALSGKNPKSFAPLKKHFSNVSRAFRSSPQVGSMVVWPSPRGTVATVSMTKIYHGTWLGHQLALHPRKRPSNVQSRKILRDIYLHAFEHAQGDPDSRWLLAYAEEHVSWNHMVHDDFASRNRSSGLAFVQPFNLMEASCFRARLPRPSMLEIGPPREGELELLLSSIKRVRQRAYLSALDLTMSRFYMEELKRKMNDAGLHRERSLLIAREKYSGELLAACIMELGSAGLNLFRLLDGVRLFSLRPGAEDTYPYLLDEARVWYLSKGREVFTCFSESNERNVANKAGLADLGPGFMWVISVKILPDFIEYLFESTVPRRVPVLR